MMTEQEKFMKAALRLAKKSAEEGEVPVGCVIVCDGKIVGRGRNRRETKKTALSHAEIEAIGKACKKLGGWRLHRCDAPSSMPASKRFITARMTRRPAPAAA